LNIPDLIIRARNYEVKLNEREIPSYARKMQICTETTELIDPGGTTGGTKSPALTSGQKGGTRSKTQDAQILGYQLPIPPAHMDPVIMSAAESQL